MDSDGGLDSTSEHHPCTDNKSSNIEKVNMRDINIGR